MCISFSVAPPTDPAPTADQLPDEEEKDVAVLFGMFPNKTLPYLRGAVSNNLSLLDAINEIFGQDSG